VSVNEFTATFDGSQVNYTTLPAKLESLTRENVAVIDQRFDQTQPTSGRSEWSMDSDEVCRPISMLPPTKEEVNVFARVCLSVCLSVSKITEKHVHGLG